MADAPRPTGTSPSDSVPRPVIIDHLVIGLNEVTKRLEGLARVARHVVGLSDQEPGIATRAPPTIAIVLVCREDISSPLLTAHFPQLVAACNSCRNHSYNKVEAPPLIKLVPLPRGAESLLSTAIGLRRVSVLAIDVSFSSTAPFLLHIWHIIE